MKSLRTLMLLFIVAFHGTCNATTWAESKVTDPIDPKLKCEVHEPMSSGSYIYQWPDKFDQVFWPMTDIHGIWFCEATGFTAFIGGFDGMTDAERGKISGYLEDQYSRKASTGTIEEKLRLLEGIYALRDTSPEFQNKLLRALARWYQNLGDRDKSDAYRAKALAQIKARLSTGGLPEGLNLEYLYLAASYSRHFGDAQAGSHYAAQLLEAINNLKDPELKGFAAYLKALSNETPDYAESGKQAR